MKSLDRMLLADVRRMWRQGLAISTLLACGIAVFVMSNTTMKSLSWSQQSYYHDGHFADLFVQLVRAPNHIADRVAAIDGVQRVQPRVVRRVLLNIPEMVEPASCQLVSIEGDQSDSINRVFLRKGRLPNDSERAEVVVSELFAESHGFQPGDHVEAIIGQRYERLRIVGIGLSAEYVYVVQPGMLVTDDRRSGVLWMSRRQMEAAFSMEGAFNDLAIQLRSFASVPKVIEQIDTLTKPYGGTGAFDRGDQPSHRRVSDELYQLRTMAYVLPTIFLAVSAFLFNIVFSRLVQQQKEQIATLRAFGYLPREIAGHYIKMVTLLVGVGAIAGLAGGLWLSDWMLTQYARFFRFPTMTSLFASGSTGVAILIGFGTALLGTFSAIRQASRLVPAEAMRPESPKEFHGLWAERLGLSRWMTPITRMIVRRIETNRVPTTLSVLGMSLGLAILVLGSFMEDTVDYVIELEFQKSQRHDAMLTFNEARSESAIDDARHLPGVTKVEPFRSVPVRMRFGRKTYRLAIMGLEPQPELFRVLDENEIPLELPEGGGLILSKKLAEILGVQLGDTIAVEILEGDRPTRQVKGV
ncbi:ABC transporter permease [Stieleria varia]|uniref:Outer membrane-specific lipoprotein transporter subunit LolC n=1 Tax=Stieleria varia TaxID=2528005 RepID=A0A5C5ZKN1_9BACT|nr:ABC transporter permease [Stieleria varia]TWT87790.1 outer membrane-specific lipoprotein transporter subunit LolC [Stieleria varia]